MLVYSCTSREKMRGGRNPQRMSLRISPKEKRPEETSGRVPDNRGRNLHIMKAKKLFAVVLALALATLCLAGCAEKADNGALTVATSPDFAPMEFVDTTKEGQEQYVGFDIELAKYIADAMGKELVIQPMSFNACQTAVSTGTVDMAISGFSWSEKREENYNLSDPYYPGDNESEQVIITTKENEGMYLFPEDFDGVKVGAQTASLQEQLCQEQLPNCEMVTVGDLGTALLQLQNGDFDCLAVAAGQADVFIANNPETIAQSGFEFVVDEKQTYNVVLLKKGNDELTEQVNAILANAYDTGVYNTWYRDAKLMAANAGAKQYTYDDDGNLVEVGDAG